MSAAARSGLTELPTGAPRPSTARVWLLATRPRTLPASLVPVLAGTAAAAADGAVVWHAALAAALGAMLLQVGANLANDAFDSAHGADTPDRQGPARATAQGWLTAAQVGWAAAGVFAAAAAVGGWLVVLGGWPVVAIGLSGIACAVLYTGGPRPLGYLGLGDLLVLLFFGPVAVLGTAWVQIGLWSTTAAWLSLPVGCSATAILVVNNLRDRHTDVRAGKRTLAVRWGRRGALVEYASLLLACLLLPVAGVLSGGLPGAAALSLLAAPLAWTLWRGVSRGEGSALNPWLGHTARFGLAHGALLALGTWMGTGGGL